MGHKPKLTKTFLKRAGGTSPYAGSASGILQLENALLKEIFFEIIMTAT